MRPVVVGNVPNDENGSPKTYAEYTDALEDLIDTLGPYCSYCGCKLSHLLEVEHVQPKTHFPGLRLSWNNFLISCKYCNTVKSDRPTDDLGNYIWPHRDNPMMFVDWKPDREVLPKPALDPGSLARTLRSLELTGLDRHPQSPTARPTRKDRRWRCWRDIWATAKFAKEQVEMSPSVTQQIVTLTAVAAKESGGFPIWMAVFEDYPEIKTAIVNAYRGTCTDCFENGNPIPRN